MFFNLMELKLLKGDKDNSYMVIPRSLDLCIPPLEYLSYLSSFIFMVAS
jgi:hypothetical protein